MAVLAAFLAACASMGGARVNRPGLPSPITPANALAAFPSDTMFLMGVNLAPIRESALWRSYVVPVLRRPDVALKLAMVERSCGFDPVESVDWVVFGMSSLDESKDDMSAIAHVRFDAAALERCVKEIARSGGFAVEIDTRDRVTGLGSGSDFLYFAWLDEHTLLFADAGMDGQREPMVAARARAGSGTPLPEVSALVKEVDTSAHAWIAVYDRAGLGGTDADAAEDDEPLYEGPSAAGVAVHLNLPAALQLRLVARFVGDEGARLAYQAIMRELAPVLHQAELEPFGPGTAMAQRGKDLVLTLDWSEEQVARFVEQFGELLWPLVEEFLKAATSEDDSAT